MGNQFPALAIQAPPGPLEQYAKATQVASGLQGLQAGQIQLNQARIQQQSQATLMKAFADNKGDMNQTLADATASGKVDPTSLINFRQATIAAQTSAAKLQETQLANHQKVVDAAGNELSGIAALPVEQRAGAINEAYGRLLTLGASPKEYGPVIQALQQDPSDANLRQHEISLMGEKWVLGNEVEQRKLPQAAAELQKTQAQTEEAKAATVKSQFETGMQSDPLLRMERNPASEMAGDKLPAAVGYLDKERNSSDPARAARATSLLAQAKVTQNVVLNQKASEIAIAQAAQEGDPNKAAQMLVDGVVAPSQIASARRPDFVEKAFSAARSLNPQWDATTAETNYQTAKNPTNIPFFGSIHSLTDKGGTLDQLAAVGSKIPQNQFPAFNKVADWTSAATGSGPIAKYAAVALGVADDYAKVMGGGAGSDTARADALNIISAAHSPEARAQAIEGIRETAASQTKSRIGKNPIMEKVYGDAVVPEKGAKAAAPAADGMIRARDANGKLHEAKKGTKLPEGWKLE